MSKLSQLIAVLVGLVLSLVHAGTIGGPFLNETTGSNCNGNCPGGCNSCPCGTNSNYQDIASWCSQHNWNQVISEIIYGNLFVSLIKLIFVIRNNASALYLMNPVEMAMPSIKIPAEVMMLAFGRSMT